MYKQIKNEPEVRRSGKFAVDDLGIRLWSYLIGEVLSLRSELKNKRVKNINKRIGKKWQPNPLKLEPANMFDFSNFAF